MMPPTDLDRALASFRTLVRSLFPALLYLGRYRYAVHSATATGFDGVPVDPSVAPALPVAVPYAPSLAGASCVPQAGTIAHVMFADGDPGQPVCVGFEAGLPVTLTLDATGTLALGPNAASITAGTGRDDLSPGTETGRAVCYGDIVVVGTATGAIQANPLSSTNPISKLRP